MEIKSVQPNERTNSWLDDLSIKTKNSYNKSSYTIYDRNDPNSHWFFSTVRIYKSVIFRTILSECDSIDLNVQRRIQDLLSKSNNNKTLYVSDILKLFDTYIKNKSLEALKRLKGFSELLDKTIKVIEAEDLTLGNARYIFKIKISTLKKLSNFSTLSNTSDEKIYLTTAINKIENKNEKLKFVSIDMEKFATLISNFKDSVDENKDHFAKIRNRFVNVVKTFSQIKIENSNFSKSIFIQKIIKDLKLLQPSNSDLNPHEIIDSDYEEEIVLEYGEVGEEVAQPKQIVGTKRKNDLIS